MQPDPNPLDCPPCDVSKRFVRVLKRRGNGLVEFEFSIGWPELAVELMLPHQDFDAFCQKHQVRRLDAATPEPTSPTV